jgi:FAD/FMN-containing dehydrogenase
MSATVATTQAQPATRPAPSPIAAPALRDLRGTIEGDVLVAGDPGYDASSGVNNTRFETRPGAIVRPASALDVSRAVLAAQELDMDVVVKSGGHSVAGLSTTNGGLLIDMRTLNGVDIDPVRWVGSAQGGVTAGEYTHAAAEHGFATPFGDALTVGLGGLTLGGGIGWLTRKHGMTIDNLLEADLVTADGQLRTVNADSDPDLFWAIRGGGGNFGIVTRFRYRLHPVSMVTGGALFLPLTRDVLRGLVDASMAAPDDLTQISMVMALPPAPFVPAELVGTPAVIVMPVHAGPLDEGAAAMAPFRALATPYIDMVGPMPYPAMYKFTEGAGEAGPDFFRSSFLPGLDDTAIDAIVDRHSRPGPFTMTQIRVLGGAMARVPSTATAFAHRNAPVMASIITIPGASAEEALAWTEDYHREISGASTGVYSNFVADEGEARIHQAYPGATYERLVRVKRRIDPANVFHANHNIRPS